MHRMHGAGPGGDDGALRPCLHLPDVRGQDETTRGPSQVSGVQDQGRDQDCVPHIDRQI